MLFTINKVFENKPRRKRGESANDAEVRFKLVNPAKVQYTLKDNNGNIVKEDRKTKPKYFYKSDLMLIPKDSVPSKIDTIERVQELNRLKRYQYGLRRNCGKCGIRQGRGYFEVLKTLNF